jgi:mono/diheme cytochrome c family protein
MRSQRAFALSVYSGDPRVAAMEEKEPKRPVAHGIYTKFCLACHGTDGKAKEMKEKMPTIPDFTDRKWQDGVSNVQLIVSILEGKGTLMPPYQAALNEDQVRDLVGYVRDFAPRPTTSNPN